MRGVILVGDVTDHGCRVETGAENSDVLGRAIARVGDRCSCRAGLGTCEIIEGDENVKVDGRAVAFDGHRTTCGSALRSSTGNAGRI